MTDTTRSHTITWEDPTSTWQKAAGMTGLEYWQALMARELPAPPIAVLMNMSPVEVVEGRIVFEGIPSDYHLNPIGTIHGGFAATLLDSALACAIHTTLPLGWSYTTLQLNLHYTRAITPQTGAVRCEGIVIHRGKTMATAEAKLTDAAGKLYAHGTTTCMVFAPREA
jgi:uncharacterized protein (TIGR00369 family)